MNQKLLSICIPVFNRKEVFEASLESACIASIGYSDYVEIVISDNNSDHNLLEIVEKIKLKYNNIQIAYNKNNVNIGAAKNLLKVVSLAKGKFCWIIGSDDFIKPNGLDELIQLIINQDLDFISIRYDYVYISFHDSKLITKHSIKNEFNNLLNYEKDLLDYKFNKKIRFDLLIDPYFDNLFLGAMMVSIFRKSVWDRFDFSKTNFDGFDSLPSIYPHAYIFAHTFVGSNGYHLRTPIISVGEGVREWTIESGIGYWDSIIPLVNFKILLDLIKAYRKSGLEINQYKKCISHIAFNAGKIHFSIIFKLLFNRNKVKNRKKYNFFKTVIFYLAVPSYYKGIFYSIKSKFLTIINK